MDKAQGAVATGESEETTSQPQPQQQQTGEAGQTSGQSVRGAVLAGLDLPEEVLKAVGAQAQGEPEQQPSQEQQQPEPEQQQPAPEPEPEADLPAAEAETQMQHDWPESARARISDETEKRKKRTAERDAWKAKAEEIAGQLQQTQLYAQQVAQQASLPRPTLDDPLANVMDLPTLAHVTRVAEELEEWCDANPNGADNVLVGRDAQGNEDRRDYPPEEIARMKTYAKRVQKRAPARENYIQAKAAAEEKAKELYPGIFKEGNDRQVAATLLEAFPEVMRTPDYLLVIGDTIAGMKARQAAEAKRNGQRTTSPSGQPLSAKASAILNAPRTPMAPGVVKRVGPDIASGPVRGGAADIQKARADFEAGGFSEEGLEKFIAAKLAHLQGGGRAGKEPTLA